MNNRFIASHGMGEIYVDPSKMAWSKFDSSLFDRKRRRAALISISVGFSQLTLQIQPGINEGKHLD